LTHGKRLNDPRLVAVAKRYSKVGLQPAARWSQFSLIQKFSRCPGRRSTAQILIRWAMQHRLVVIPKSAKRERIRENADVFDFEITKEDMQLLDGFNENLRTCWDPTNAP
jgi:diketogulonate reductase-like aldo/keto reductase